MTDTQFERLETQLKDSYHRASFDLDETDCVPNLDELKAGEAAKLNHLGFGFIDIRGFTRWSRTKRDKSVFKVLEPTLQTLTRVVRLHGGTVEKPTGDGLMFIVGAGETDRAKVAVRTLHCALDLADVLDNLISPFLKRKRHITEPFGWGIGVDIGSALVAKVGIRGHYHLTSIARAANFASKLEDEALAGHILVGSNIASAVPDSVNMNLSYYGEVHEEQAYELNYERDDDGRIISLAKHMTTEQVKRFDLAPWLLGGALIVAAAAAKGQGAAKPQRWYGQGK